MVEISPALSQAPSQVPATAEVVGSTPPASQAEAAKGTSHDSPSGQDLGSLEVECREALRAQLLSFPFEPGEVAASTLARCRTAASMASLDTLAVWPDGGILDLTLTLEESLRSDERRLLATGPAVASDTQAEGAEPSPVRRPITSPDGLTCLACGQRAPSVEHMSGHFMTSAHVRAVKAYLAQ